ncbi:MAG: TIGR00299 family protein [Desulfobacterales bacterium CG23_combo_of_CG06-09_8_20_14_all_51_8]|nr:MAG: TIGR00299 family protein [Desulfobacterales bacterium CG23_combo_of_CG06-09_8_20_14_all_51_8]
MIAYFDCFAGISGDMTLGAFVDAGVPAAWLADTIKAHLITDFDLTVTPVSKMGISATKVDVIVNTHAERDYDAIRKLIERSFLIAPVKDLSLAVFEKLAAAESKIHGCPKHQVHFHEVGGVDAIVDIVGAALCVDYLKLETITASKIPLGSGFVRCAHGTLPVPAPATVEILKDIPVYGTEISSELVTPTGAAIISTLASTFGPMPDMRISQIGWGAGFRDLNHIPNLLRIFLGTPANLSDTVTVIETTIDDMNPEVFGYLMERLFEDGALDVCLIPVFMKKNRPGTLVQVLCSHYVKETLISRILTETTTLGVRCFEAQRRILKREPVRLETEFGEVSAKKIHGPDGRIRIVPEYEVCRRIARERNIPILTVYQKIGEKTGQHPENLIK